MKDTLFDSRKTNISPFRFDESVAGVFDDMVSRSIPFYDEIHKIILDLVAKKADIELIYDLGCSTGTSLKLIQDFYLSNDLKAPTMIGVDTSCAMIKKAKEKLTPSPKVIFLEEDITQVNLKDCELVVMNYTLQFLNPEQRQSLVNKVYHSLRPGGLFIMSEKIVCNQKNFDELFIDLYYDFKRRNGYSEMAISQKREALENILIPYNINQNTELLTKSGFTQNELLFKWYNFACFLGIK